MLSLPIVFLRLIISIRQINIKKPIAIDIGLKEENISYWTRTS
jgi:hypothetical protein